MTSTELAFPSYPITFGDNHSERHHLETVRCGVARRRHSLPIIDVVVVTTTSVRQALLLHQPNAECLSANEGIDVDDDH